MQPTAFLMPAPATSMARRIPPPTMSESEAKAAWAALVADQPENYRFINGLQISYLQLEQEIAKEVRIPCAFAFYTYTYPLIGSLLRTTL